MSNPLKPRPLDAVIQELIKMGADPFGPTVRLMQDLTTRADLTVTNTGQIQSVAPIKGRTEGIAITVTGLASTGDILAATKVVGRVEGLGTTTANLNSSGQLLSTDAIAADGTGSPLQGGKNGFKGLGTTGQLLNTLKNNPVNCNGAFVGGVNPLSQHLTTTQIDVTAWSIQFGAIIAGTDTASSVDPGSFGKWYIYVVNPGFAQNVGFAFPVFATANVNTLQTQDGIMCLGVITTAGGGGAVGLGTGGGGSSGVRSLVA